MPVTGCQPIGGMVTEAGPPEGGITLTIWECATCKALINDVTGHERWHAEQES